MSSKTRYKMPISSSSSANRSWVPENSIKNSTAGKTHLAKKRPALLDVTNQRNASLTTQESSHYPKQTGVCRSKVTSNSKDKSSKRSNQPKIRDAAVPARFSTSSVSIDESMSTCDSLKSPEYVYADSKDASSVKSIDLGTSNNLKLSRADASRNIYTSGSVMRMDTADKVVDIDYNVTDPQFCTFIACDVYRNLRASEVNKRPLVDFMEKVQEDINSGMRAVLIDWLVEVAEEYRLVPETLFLAVNYIDRYLSRNSINRQQLQLLGVACMMIAAKYEEICAPQVEEFCYVTDNTYTKEEVLEMESTVLNHLKFEMTAPTAQCFLRRFVCVAQGTAEVPSMQLECLANYLIELSLLEYGMLRFFPSLIAASATFLAKLMLFPRKKPWDSTLRYYTCYKASEVCDCVKELHRLCNTGNSHLVAVREKYSQHKYKFVAKKYCLPSIPPEYFQDINN